MEHQSFHIEGVKLITPRLFEDARGGFSETYNAKSFGEILGDVNFIQDNYSLSRKTGTVRGLHFQRAPMAQSKLVRVLRGSIFDVALDVRPGSPTYLQHVAVELSAANRAQLFVPRGFLHGFATLEDDTEVAYKVDNYYSGAHDGSILWNDPALKINWPVTADAAILSDKDARAPRLADAEPPFAAGEV